MLFLSRRENNVDRTEQERRIADFIGRRVWAVVGASLDEQKYGNRIYHSLRNAGYTVYPVNPKGGEIEGAKIYPSLADLPRPPEVIDIVVPPPVTEKVVKEAHELGLNRVWMQPGAESEAAIDYCEENGMEVVHGTCIMLHKRRWN